MTIRLNGAGQSYTNTGAVSDDPAAVLSGSGTTLVNEGRLSSPASLATVVITGDGGTIINSGQVFGSSLGSSSTLGAIQGGDGADSVTNRGNIDGSVRLGSGNDVYVDDGGALSPGSVVDLGEGQDTYRVIAAGSFASFSADGGAGVDTIVLEGSFDFAALGSVTSFEALRIDNVRPVLYPSLPEIGGASDFSMVSLAAGVTVAFRHSNSPAAEIAIDGGALGLYEDSRFASVSGGSRAEELTLSGSARVDGTIAMGGGDDAVILSGFATPATAITIDGGTGSDTLTVANPSRLNLDMSSIRGFEHLVIGYGDASVEHASGLADISATGFVTFAASDLSGTSLIVSGSAPIIIAADVRFGVISVLDPSSLDGTSIRNAGVILGSVQLGAGADMFFGDGAVNGTVYGNGGSDFLSGGQSSDRLDGGDGADTLTGGAGSDTFQGTQAEFNGDSITDLSIGDRILFTDADAANFHFSLSGSTLSYGGGQSLSIVGGFGGRLHTESVAGGGVALVATAGPPSAADFDGNAHSDFLWRNTNGAVSTWTVSGDGHQVQQGAYNGYVDTSWHISDTLDFNGDGRADILFRQSGGAVAVWDSTGGGFDQSSYYLADPVPTDWRIAGTGDVTGDGKDDLIWQRADGVISTWTSTGTGFQEAAYNHGSVGTAWQVEGLADFNGDGLGDILWRNTDGSVSTWLNDARGGFVEGSYYFAGVPTSWHIDGTGDFDGDGKADLLWRNDNGAVSEWRSNGNGFDQSVYNSSAPTDWHIAATGDFNDDGRADILFHNDDGRVSTWQSNGAGFDQSIYNAAAPTDWSIAAHTFVL